MSTKMNVEELETQLQYFNGSEDFHRHWMPNHYYTDGVQYLAENAGAFWLIDAIVSHQHSPKVRREEFQVWTLKVENRKAVLVCEDGREDSKPLATQKIEYTDFPLEEIKLYFEVGSLDGEHLCKILMLPSER